MPDHQDKLNELNEAIPVAPDRSHLPRYRAKRRAGMARGVAGLGVAALLAGGGYLALNRNQGTTEIAAESRKSDPTAAAAGSVAFSQRIVDGPIAYARWSGYGPNGTLYVLSTAPGVGYPEAPDNMTEEEAKAFEEAANRLPQALYSTRDGETWATTELGDRHFDSLRFQNGLLYGLSTSEAANGAITYEYLRSTNGGQSWDSSLIPVDVSVEPKPWLLAPSYSMANLAVNDTAHLITVSVSSEPNLDWFADQLGVDLADEGPWPEFREDRVVVLDYSECQRLSEEMDRRFEAAVAEAVANGMSEEEAWSQFERELYGSGPESSADMQAIDKACSNPPVIVSRTYDDLGIGSPGPGHGVSTRSTYRSTDGIGWEPVDVPGDWVYVSGSGFVSEKWPETYTEGAEEEPEYFTSDDGVSWTRVDSRPEGQNWQGIGQFQDRLGGFRSGDPEYEEEAEAEGPWPTKIYFGTSDDWLNWAETLIYENPNTDSYSYMDFSAVGPLGAVAVINTQPIGQDSIEVGDNETVATTTTLPAASAATTGESESAYTESEPEEAEYQEYLAGITTTILYSPDGITWTEIEVDGPPDGWISNLFVTTDSIGLTYEVYVRDEGQPSTKTVLLTPER